MERLVCKFLYMDVLVISNCLRERRFLFIDLSRSWSLSSGPAEAKVSFLAAGGEGVLGGELAARSLKICKWLPVLKGAY